MKLTNIPEKEIERIHLSYKVFDIPYAYQSLINDAIKSLNNGEFIFDGSTGDLEWWPTSYEPASFVHDFLWRTGQGGKTSDKIFKKIMIMYRMPTIWRTFRYISVRIGWIFYYYWVYLFNGNLRPIKTKYKKLIK